MLFGWAPAAGDLIVFFSARLDETGTDGRSPFAIVAGAVSVPREWDVLEGKWNQLLQSRHVSAFHTKELNQRIGDFDGWSDLKVGNFAKRQEKILKDHVVLEIAVAVEHAEHTRIKKEWRGVRNFKGDSACGICFRVARHLICKKLAEMFSPQDTVAFIVEDGPYAADMHAIYQSLKRTAGAKYRPASYVGMLAGWAAAGSEDTELGVFMEPEVGHGTTEVYTRVQA